MDMSMDSYLDIDKIDDVDRVVWQTAVNALNDLHQKHGVDKMMKCDVCTSKTAEMTIARHFQKMVDKLKLKPPVETSTKDQQAIKALHHQLEILESAEKHNKEKIKQQKIALDKITWIAKHTGEG